jgi:hypothetical protein
MNTLKRWAPVVGTVVLSVAEVLETLGEKEAAAAVRASVASVGAAAIALVGVGLKVASEYRKYRDRLTTVSGR